MGTEVKPEFNNGDVVVCIKGQPEYGLKEGASYVVKSGDDLGVFLDCGYWVNERFKLASMPCGCTTEVDCEKHQIAQVTTPPVCLALPTQSEARKAIPLASGLLDYFPAALAAIAEVSRVGNEKHNPGQPLHHARGKSTDHADCIMRHLVDRGRIDPDDNTRHSAKVAWRALALLQEELEAEGAPMARGAKNVDQ